MKKKWKWIFGGLAAGAILLVMLFSGSKGLEADVLKAQQQTIAKTFQEEGKVVPELEFPVFSTYGGKIVSLPAQEGNLVKKGETLAILDTQELQYQLRQLEANLLSVRGEEASSGQQPYESQVNQQQLAVAAAEQQLQTAKTYFARMETLYQSGAISLSEYEETLNRLESAQNTLKQQQEALTLLYESSSLSGGTEQYFSGMKKSLQAQIELVKHQIEKSTITAPSDGVVAHLAVKEGTVVTPGAPIATVFRNDEYEVEVYLLTSDISSVQKGMTVDLVQNRADGDAIFSGSVTRIAPAAEDRVSSLGLTEQRIKVTIKPDVPEGLKLRPGYALDVQFTVDKQENRLVMPKTALFPYEGGDGEALWVVRDGKAAIQPVKTGFETDQDIVISEGLKPGDLVILDPQLEGIEEGKKIRVSGGDSGSE